MNIPAVKYYFYTRCTEIQTLADRGDPCVFLCGSAIIDYLAKLTTNISGRCAYIKFVKNCFREVDPRYSNFRFSNGMQDLPIQMYVVLRCGIVRNFSFVPTRQGLIQGGRARWIMLAHEKNGFTHFAPYTNEGMDAVIFTAEQFSRDIFAVVTKIFEMAASNVELENWIQNYIVSFPPQLWGPLKKFEQKKVSWFTQFLM